MATRKSSPTNKTGSYEGYVTPTLEDRVRSLERRATRTENHRAWDNSLAHRTCISLAVYIGSALMLITLMVPGWFTTAFMPVACYWIYILFLNLARTLWTSHFIKRKP